MRQLKIEKKITSRTDDVTGRYLNDITRYELLNVQQEIEICEKIKAGCVASKEKLIKANLRFVISVAKQYIHREILIDDIIAFGNIGLIEAAGRFDHTKGFKFITYAVWWIRQSIQYGIGEMKNQIRLPLNQNQNRIKAARLIDDMVKKENREPTPYELAKSLAVPTKEINKILFSVFSMDSYRGPSEDTTYHGSVEDVTAIHADVPISIKTQRDYLMKILRRKLTDKEIKIITDRHGFNGDERTLQCIASEMGLTYERARQIYVCALKKLRREKQIATML